LKLETPQSSKLCQWLCFIWQIVMLVETSHQAH